MDKADHRYCIPPTFLPDIPESVSQKEIVLSIFMAHFEEPGLPVCMY